MVIKQNCGGGRNSDERTGIIIGSWCLLVSYFPAFFGILEVLFTRAYL